MTTRPKRRFRPVTRVAWTPRALLINRARLLPSPGQRTPPSSPAPSGRAGACVAPFLVAGRYRPVHVQRLRGTPVTPALSARSVEPLPARGLSRQWSASGTCAQERARSVLGFEPKLAVLLVCDAGFGHRAKTSSWAVSEAWGLPSLSPYKRTLSTARSLPNGPGPPSPPALSGRVHGRCLGRHLGPLRRSLPPRSYSAAVRNCNTVTGLRISFGVRLR